MKSFGEYHEKVKRYQELFVRQGELEQTHRQSMDDCLFAINVIKFLKDNAFSVDQKLIKYVEQHKESVQEWIDVLDRMEQLESELKGPRNFRHIVQSISSEMGLSLVELAKNINCSSDNALVELCEAEKINKLDFQKVCSYFGLREELWENYTVLAIS